MFIADRRQRAATARILDAGPGQGRVQVVAAVHEPGPGVDLAADAERAAFVLREIEGLDTAEVAGILGVTESTVRNHVLQARRVLKAGLLRDYPGFVPASGGGKEREDPRK